MLLVEAILANSYRDKYSSMKKKWKRHDRGVYSSGRQDFQVHKTLF